jgi:hypothetical protein
MSGNSVSRATLFALLLVTLTVAFMLLTPKPAAACPVGFNPATTTIYYTDASRTKISCTAGGCDGTTCTPTPYFRTLHLCCSA